MSDLKKIDEIVLGERKFLHDVSNYLVVAQGMSSFLQKALTQNDGVGQKEKERLEKVVASVKKISEAVKERRDYLHSINNK